MSRAYRFVSCPSILIITLLVQLQATATAEPIPLKRVVDLALSHSTTLAVSHLDEQRAFASYLELRNQYIPQMNIGSGLGGTWGYPLSLEGSAPSIVNTTAQSAVLNPALREFMRAARTDMQAAAVQTKDQRDQVIQDAVQSYAELNKWEMLNSRLSQEYSEALKMEQFVNERIQEGVDSPQARTQARLSTARVYLRISQAQGASDVLRHHLAALTGLAADSIQTVADSIPAFPEVKQDTDLAAKAVSESNTIEIASLRATALTFRAKGEHRALWPTFDFAAQYALLATFNNYQQFFQPHSFQSNNASVGAVIRFPFFNRTQSARAQAADAEAVIAKKNVDAAKNQVSEQTLRLQRSVEQLAAAQQVADLESQVAQSALDAVKIRLDAGSATWQEAEDARNQANERYDALQDADFELKRAQIALLRATGELDNWVGAGR